MAREPGSENLSIIITVISFGVHDTIHSAANACAPWIVASRAIGFGSGALALSEAPHRRGRSAFANNPHAISESAIRLITKPTPCRMA